ncbi:MAG: MFS transporter [Caldilineaceae bacterium]|nr:MFS transporter [Caldilineaceae bacterium]
MRAFLIFWFGQLVSLLGTNMSRFALTIWAWELTGQATALALVAVFSFAPAVLVSPIAGAMVDRLPRKLMMMLSDAAAGLASFVILLLYLSGTLEIWHLYVAGAFTGIFESFQFPAFSAAISTMVPKEQYGRANGLLSLAESVSAIAAPVLAGLLLALMGIGGILVIDVVTCLFAIVVLLFITVPQPKRTTDHEAQTRNFWGEVTYGFRYILTRPSLLGLQMTFLASNFLGGIGLILVNPMVLARSSNELALATVQTAFGIGGVVGGLLLSTWGGPKRRVHGVLFGFIWASLFQVWLGIGQSLWVWSAASFILMISFPIINGSNQAIWQAKVAPDVQGRVFAARRVFAQLTGPLGMALAGPLADWILEPAMREGGALVDALGWLFGTGPGAGMGLLISLTGLAGIAVGITGYAIPAIYHAESRLPDHDEA